MAEAARALDMIDVTPFTAADAAAYEAHFAGVATQDMLAELLEGELKGRIAAVSSFGTESAVLLHMIARVDRDVPVIFTNTQKMFGETLEYRDALSEQLGQPLPLAGRTVLITSQSGESAEVLRWFSGTGDHAETFGLTLEAGSFLGRTVPCLVGAGGTELAFAATRSLTVTFALHLAILAALGERVVELELDIEMIFDDALVAAGDENEMLYSRLACLVYDILDNRPVDDRQHFLGNGLGCGKKARTEPRDRENCLAYFFHEPIIRIAGHFGNARFTGHFHAGIED